MNYCRACSGSSIIDYKNAKESRTRHPGNPMSRKLIWYLLSIYATSFIISAILAFNFYVKIQSYIYSALLGLFFYIPITELMTQIVQAVLSKFIRPKEIPKLDLSMGIPEEFKTFVVIPTIIGDVKKIDQLIQKLEVYYLANKSENIYFALLRRLYQQQQRKRTD